MRICANKLRTGFAVLLAIASFWSQKGCHPKTEQIAELTGLSPSTVKRARKILRRKGLLSWIRGHTGVANEYFPDFGPVRGGGGSTEPGRDSWLTGRTG